MDQDYNGNGMVFGGDNSFFSFDPSTLDHQPSGDTILTNTEDDYLSTFFDNPNMAQQPEAFDNMFNLGGKPFSQGTFSSTPAFAHSNDLDPSSFDPSQPYQPAHNLADVSTHHHQQQPPSFVSHAGFLTDSSSHAHPHTQTMNNADMSAATSLFGFTNKTAPLTHNFLQNDNGAQLAGSWGNLIVAQNSNMPPGSSSGGYATALNAGSRGPPFAPNAQSWTGSGDGDTSQANRSQMARGSESHYTVEVDPFHGAQPQSNPSGKPQLRDFPGVDFGSDTSFGKSHYQGPQHNKDKSGNLLNVPLADKVRVPYGPHAMANQHTDPNNGGSWGRFAAAGFTRHLDEDEVASGSRARKRQKGYDGRNDEHGWDSRFDQQSGHGSRMIKLEQTDEEPSMPAPSIGTTTSSAKRRRPTDIQVSQVSDSPPANQDVDGGETSARKRGAKKRENLTEDQKRKNHIYSEKKRREIIQQGYADLNTLVPCLSNGKSGLSRSECLQEISSYIETLTTGNEKMMEKLAPDIDENHPALLAAHAEWVAATSRIE